MKQALEALEMLAKWEHPASNITTKSGRIYPHHVAKNAAATLRLAIEQAEKQEPVLWEPKIETLYQDGFVVSQRIKRTPDGPWEEYTAPPQRQPHELLCVCGASWSIDGEGNEELLSTPPQRQPLTDGEIVEIAWDWKSGGPIDFARAIERKHGIGGGG